MTDPAVSNKKRILNRRQILKGALGIGACMSAFPLTKAQALKRDVDVIVIGAGVAGMTTAQALVQEGYDVLVLEAKDTIGGRLKTDWSLGAPFEVGAGWIHGPVGNPITDLAKSVQAKSFVTDDDSSLVFDHKGGEVEDKIITNKFKDLMRVYKKIDGTFDSDQSLEKAIKRVSPQTLEDPVSRWMLSAYTEFDTGGPIENLSAYYFDEDEAFDGADVVLLDGYDSILEPLADKVDVLLNHPVDHIEYEAGDGVTVHANGEAFEAYVVVCTCPLGVLKSKKVKFSPALPSRIQKKIDRLGMGNVTKAALKFESAFWPIDTQYFGVMTEDKGRWNYFLNYRTFSDENILLGLSVGAYAGKIEQLPEKDIVDDCMMVVRDMFGVDISEPINFQVSRWSKDPYSLGAYSYTRVGNKPADFDGFTDPVEDTLIFAGEHTTFKHHATVHGAYLSGLRAAEQVMELIE